MPSLMRSFWSAFVPERISEVERFSFEFGAGLPAPLGVLLAVLAGLAAGAYAFRGMKRGSHSLRLLMSGLRGCAGGLMLFLILDPTLTAYQVRPSDQTVAVVFDDSRSMQIRHGSDSNRGELLRAAYKAQGDGLDTALRKRFQVAYFGFGANPYRISSPETLTFTGRHSRIRQSLEDIEREVGPEKLAGIVLLSDGVERAPPSRSNDRSQATAALQVPVIAAALPEVSWREFEVGRFAAPRVDFVDAPVILDVPIRAKTLKGRKLEVELIETPSEDGGGRPRILQSRTVQFDSADDNPWVRFEFKPESEGRIVYTVRANLIGTPVTAAASDRPEEAGGDLIAENNARSFLLDTTPETYRIFYFSGRPNWENAFVRRALGDERQLSFTSHIRISEAEKKFVFRGKQSSMSNRLFEGFDSSEVEPPRYDEAVFLRFGNEAEPLSEGYPTREVDLFEYDLVIWSDIEYEFFNQEQIRQTREFVRKRGGTLLLLGGPGGFSEANFAGTLVEGLLPVLLSRSSSRGRNQSAVRAPEEWRVSPTLEGEISGALSLAVNPDLSQQVWDGMPPLSGVNPFAAIRPGATVAAKAVRDENSRPLYVYHRYGEGRTAALATGTTWLWKMERPPDDTVHERIWRQMIRDLVRDAPDPVRLLTRRDAYASEETSELEFEARDRNFNPREALQIHIEVTEPDGGALRLPIDESLEIPGLYRAAWTPRSPGVHTLRFTARDDDGSVIGEREDHLFVEDDLGEYFDAKPDLAELETLTRDTGGRVLTLEELASAVQFIPWTPPASVDPLRFHLWHLPPFYGLLTGLLCVEWFLRRRRGWA